MSRHRSAADRVPIRGGTTSQRKKLEELGWTISRRIPKGWKLEGPSGEVIVVKCCLRRALSRALAAEVWRK